MNSSARSKQFHLPIARYGWRELLACGVVLAAVAVVLMLWGRWAYATIPIALLAFTVSFFRDPERAVPAEPGVLVAPADGRIVEISHVNESQFIGGPALRIGIFLSVFDVHVNRAPCDGVVKTLSYRKGRFRNALVPASSEENESNSIGIETAESSGKRVVVRQIAGAVARRIVCDCREGQSVQRGQRIGMIKFGSRTELYVPADAPFVPVVDVGQRVKGGSTILGRFECAGEDEA